MPVSTRRQTQHAKHLHSLSHTNLNNFPTEIVDEIAHHLNPDPEDGYHSDFSDVSYERMSVTSANSDMDKVEVKVMPCCRPGDEEVHADESRIPVLDDRLIFSATSRRMRDVVFNRRQTRRRTIRYCDRWKEETMQLSEAIRSRYTYVPTPFPPLYAAKIPLATCEFSQTRGILWIRMEANCYHSSHAFLKSKNWQSLGRSLTRMRNRQRGLR
jgi:hypothetical protein